MKKHITSLFAVSIAVSVSACSFKKSERGANEDARPTELTIQEAERSETRSANEAVVTKQIETLDLKSIYDRANSIHTEAEATSVLEALERSTIQSSVWMDPKLRISDKVITSLSYYNFALIRLMEIAPDSPKTSEAMDRYKKMAMAATWPKSWTKNWTTSARRIARQI